MILIKIDTHLSLMIKLKGAYHLPTRFSLAGIGSSTTGKRYIKKSNQHNNANNPIFSHQ